MNYSLKKAISPVVAVALFLVLTVVAAVAFQSWYANYESTVLVKIEGSDTQTDLLIKSVVGSVVYVESSKAENVTRVLLNSRDCGLDPQFLKGLNTLDLSTCIGNLSSSKVELTIVTTSKVISKNFHYDQEGVPVWLTSYTVESNSNRFNTLSETSDGGFAVGTILQNASHYFFSIQKYDARGALLWRYEVPKTRSSSIRSVLALKNGSIVGVGELGEVANDVFYAVLLDSKGNQIWNYTVDNDDISGQGGIVEETNGDIVLSASTTGDNNSLYLVKLDSSGQEVWNTTYFIDATAGTPSRDLVKRHEGGYISVGSTNPGSNLQLFITAFDEDGTYLWNKTYGSASSDLLNSISQSSDGGYLVVGQYRNSDTDIFLQKVNGTGDNIWNVSYNFASGTDIGQEGLELSDGNIALTAYRNSNPYLAILMKLNSTGSELWNRTFYLSNSQWNLFKGLEETGDLGFVVSGYRNNGTNDAAIIMKLDSNGTSCSTDLTDCSGFQ